VTDLIVTERVGPVLRMRINRPDKRNAFTREMLDGLGLAYGELDRDADLRVGVLDGAGSVFTAGLDLPAIAGELATGGAPTPPDGYVDPFGLSTPRCSKPVVVAVHGRCYTLGIEMILAADIAVAAAGTRFAQLEVARGILPLAGANWRFPQRCGWGNAMRWILTGAEFDAVEAMRIGLVQEVTPADAGDEAHVAAAMAIAERIAAMAPQGVRGSIANGLVGAREGEAAAIADVRRRQRDVFASADAREAIAAMVERRDAVFTGQ
jgi:enoyl-CoA hydratase/carnithine racemase